MIKRTSQLLNSINIVVLIAFTVIMLMAGLVFFVIQSNTAAKTLINIMEDNHTVTRKMQLYGQLMEYARSRTRLTGNIIREPDPFVQDEINLELEIFANQYARARLELLSLPLSEEEKAVLDSQNALVAEILPAQRKVVTLAMQGDQASRQAAQHLLDTVTYPGQHKLVESFLGLLEKDTQRQREKFEQGQQERLARAKEIRWITNLALSLGVLISLLVIYRVYQNQKEVTNTRLNLEQIVEEKTHNLAANEERLIKSQEIAHVGTWDWDIEANTIYWSDETYRVFGLLPNQFEASYEMFLKYVHKADVDSVNKALEDALNSPGAEYNIVHRIIRHNGEERTVEELGKVIRDDEGMPVRMIGAVHDITDRIQAEKSKSEFVATISHELRTPLTAIQGSVKLLLGNALGELNEGVRGILNLANSNCDRLLHLVNDILDLQKMESGNMEYHFQDVMIKTIMSEAIDSSSSYADAHEVKLKQERVDDATIHADNMRLIQVMNNLVSNAVKFSDKGNEVKISAVLNDHNKVIFSVEDHGRGIPEEHRDKLFNRFTQVDSSDKREKLGTGLGLAITKDIIEAHQGRIWYESELDKGTTFYFELDAVA